MSSAEQRLALKYYQQGKLEGRAQGEARGEKRGRERSRSKSKNSSIPHALNWILHCTLWSMFVSTAVYNAELFWVQEF